MLDKLYESLQKRLRPEDVAELILSELRNDLSSEEKRILQKATAGSLKNLWYQTDWTHVQALLLKPII